MPTFGAVAACGGLGERSLAAYHQLVVDYLGCEILRIAAWRVDLDHELVLRLPDVDGGQPAARTAVGRGSQAERAAHLLADRVQVVQQTVCSYTRGHGIHLRQSIGRVFTLANTRPATAVYP